MFKILTDNRGSFTVEATIIVPFFLVFLVFLINFIRVTAVYVAMDFAVSETAKTVAAYSYPLRDTASITSIAVNQISGTSNGNITTEQILSGSLSGQQLAAAFGLKVLDKSLQNLVKVGTETAKDAVITEIVKNKIVDKCPFRIDDQGFKLREVRAFEGKSEDVHITVEYSVKLPMPFFPIQEFTLTNTAIERGWADG